MNVMFRSLGKM